MLVAKYSAKRDRKTAQSGDDREKEREEKRQRLIEDAVELVRSLPRQEDTVEKKRQFSVDLAKMILSLDTSPRHQKAEKSYLELRDRQTADQEKKDEMFRNYDAAHKASDAQERAAEADYQEKMAEIRAAAVSAKGGPAGPKKRSAPSASNMKPKKAPMTEEEKKERRKAYAKRAYEKKRQGARNQKLPNTQQGRVPPGDLVEVPEWEQEGAGLHEQDEACWQLVEVPGDKEEMVENESGTESYISDAL